MFYLEAQSKVGQSPLKDEIQQGEVMIGEGSANGNTPKSGASRGGGGGSGRKKRGR